MGGQLSEVELEHTTKSLNTTGTYAFDKDVWPIEVASSIISVTIYHVLKNKPDNTPALIAKQTSDIRIVRP